MVHPLIYKILIRTRNLVIIVINIFLMPVVIMLILYLPKTTQVTQRNVRHEERQWDIVWYPSGNYEIRITDTILYINGSV